MIALITKFTNLIESGRVKSVRRFVCVCVCASKCYVEWTTLEQRFDFYCVHFRNLNVNVTLINGKVITING